MCVCCETVRKWNSKMLIILCGLPASGKSARAKELKEFFEKEKGKVVNLISENVAIPKAGFRKNEYFSDSQKEKIVRSDLKSEVIRSLNKDTVTILDAGNYIKGYRYEIYCATKSARVSQCTIYCAIPKDQMKEFNKDRQEEDTEADLANLNNSNIKYSDEILEALCLRFEEPHGNNRWDAPLFTVLPDQKLDVDGIYTALFEKGPPPPNQSTQNPPLSDTNYLFELDKITTSIIQQVLQARKDNPGVGPLKIDKNLTVEKSASQLSSIQLNKLRRQFLNYTKMHTSSASLDKAPQLFVQFINSNS